jgi:glucokinase
MKTILAGDIGGTKTHLGFFEIEDGSLEVRNRETFPSREFSGLESIIDEFVTPSSPALAGACFGVAGPVIEGRSATSNLPWVVDSKSLAHKLNLKTVTLLNDLEAAAHGIPALKPDEVAWLNKGNPTPGNAGMVSAGTGLGLASLFWDGKRHVPSASEGGHVDFAPRNEYEIALLKYLLDRFDHVSVERIVSGPGLLNVYEFLRDTGRGKELPSIAARFKDEDPSAVVGAAALTGECEMCTKALDTVVTVYGAAAGNFALELKATAGIYVGGGIAPKIISKLGDGTFMKAFLDKGRLRALLEATPVRVILNEKIALLGAARVAAGIQ